MVSLRRSLTALLCAAAVAGCCAQLNEVRRMPEVKHNPTMHYDYREADSGFWWSIELGAGYSCRLNADNFGLTELDVTLGYRFNEYFRIGAGIGGRYYLRNDRVRRSDIAWAMPLYLNLRGNFIPTADRPVVPYYSIDLGACVRDGFMVRPSVGIRVGQRRSAFLLALTYTGQHLKGFTVAQTGDTNPRYRFINFIGLKLGYEF